MTDDTDSMNQFLLIYDRNAGILAEVKEFGTNIEKATIEYRAAELCYHDSPGMDVVLIGSDSLDAVKKTHSTYFHPVTSEDIESIMKSIHQPVTS